MHSLVTWLDLTNIRDGNYLAGVSTRHGNLLGADGCFCRLENGLYARDQGVSCCRRHQPSIDGIVDTRWDAPDFVAGDGRQVAVTVT